MDACIPPAPDALRLSFASGLSVNPSEGDVGYAAAGQYPCMMSPSTSRR
jgi:hypothetical protein